MIKHDDGKVALRYHKAVSKYVPVAQNTGYIFQVRNNVSIAWVDEKDIQQILRMKSNCMMCPTYPYTIATQEQVSKWYGAK